LPLLLPGGAFLSRVFETKSISRPLVTLARDTESTESKQNGRN